MNNVCNMHNIVKVFSTLICCGVFCNIQSNHDSKFSRRSILSKYSHRREPRELYTGGIQASLELADLSGNIPNPCNNGGTLLRNIKRNSYVCQCLAEYEGRHCEKRTRVCFQEEQGACKFNKNSSVTSECRAVQGNGFVCYKNLRKYKQSWCMWENMESRQPICPQSWTCLDHVLGKNTGYRCLPPGHIVGPKIGGNRRAGNVGKCSCQNGGHCIEDMTCACLPHFTGLYCESFINYCESNPCPLNIECEPVLGGHICNCSALQSGPNCERTGLVDVSTMVRPRFNYHANQYASISSTCLFYVEEIGALPRLIIDFGDESSTTVSKEDFHSTEKLNDVLMSFLYQPIAKKGTVHLVNLTHTYTKEGLYNITITAWNREYITMRRSFTVRVHSPDDCEFSVELINAATTPDNATVYQRRHAVNIHSVSVVTCPGTRLNYLWELFTVPNIFTTHTPEMSRRLSPDVYTRTSEFHVPPYSLSFGNFALRLTVEMLEPAQGGKKTVDTWFKIVKDGIIAHITEGNIRQVHESEAFQIDGSESYDPNFPFDTMRFEWTCSVPNTEDMVPGICDEQSNPLSNDPMLHVESNLLKQNGVYIFTVKVESIERDQARQSIQIQVVSEVTELVHIVCVQNCLGNGVITTSPMALRAISQNSKDNMEYIWTLTYNSDEPVSPDADAGYYSDGNDFVTKPGALFPARSYQISVRVINRDDSSKQVGTAAIDLLTYPLLRVGFCIVSPSQGYALLTKFQIKCFLFIVNYLPVTFEVFQYRLPKEEPIMIGFGFSPEFENITLAAGLPENDYSTALRVYASDSKGNFGFYEQDITVFPAAMYTNLKDELAMAKKMILGTASTVATNVANQEVRSVIQTILSATSSVHTLSQHLRNLKDLRQYQRVWTHDATIQDQIDAIVHFKDTMVEYLAHCELHSPTIAKYCSSTLTSILECDYDRVLRNGMNLSYADKKAVTVLDNIVGMLHKMTQKSEDTTVIRTDVLDIGTTILSCISLLLRKPTGQDIQTTGRRHLDSNQRQKQTSLDIGEEKQLAKQTEAVINNMDNYASLFARYMAPHEDDYLTNPLEDICISVQKTNRGLKTVTLPAYVEVNVSISSDDINDMYDLQVITLKNNPYWWEKNADDINFPLIKVDIFNTIKESRSRIARVGASRRHEIKKSKNQVHGADLKFFSPRANSLQNHPVIQGNVVLKPTWNYTDSDISVHKLEFRAGGKTILSFDDQEDDVVLRVVVKENSIPNLNDFWESKVIPKFEDKDLSERQKRSIYLDSVNDTQEYVLYYVGVLPHQTTIRSLLRDIDPPLPDSLLYDQPPPEPKKKSDYIAYSFKAYNAQCLRWSNLQREWTNHCKVVESDLTESTMSCHCDGLSTIGASFRSADVVERVPFKFSQFIKFLDNSLIFWFLVYVTVCFLGLFAWGGMRDRRDKRHDKLIVLDDNNVDDTYCYIILVQTDKNLDSCGSSRVAVLLEGSEGNSYVHVLNSTKRRVMISGSRDYFILLTRRSLGDVFCLHLWHNNKGSKPTWHIDKVIVHDVKTHHVSIFMFNTWLPPLSDTGRSGLSCYRMLNNETLSWTMLLTQIIGDMIDAGYHCWLGMCLRQLPRNNTRRRRVVLGFVHVCVLMASVTAFYPLPEQNLAVNRIDESDKFTFEWEEVFVGVLSAIIAFLLNCVLFCIAKNVAPVQSYTTDYSSRYVEELVIPIPANSGTTAPRVDKNISLGDGIELSDLYKPGENQVIKKRTVPLRVPQARSQRAFYDEVISGMGPIQGIQRIRSGYLLTHTYLYPLWVFLGVVLLMALYFILFYATFYSWSIGLRYLFATCVGFIFSFAVLEPSKVMVCAFWQMRKRKGSFVIDDRSRIALYLTNNLDTTQLENNRTASLYKLPTA